MVSRSPPPKRMCANDVKKIFCQSHDSWLTSLRRSAVVQGLDVPGRELNSKPHAAEKDFTNRIFHGEQCRGLAIHTQLSSLCLKPDQKARLGWYFLRTVRNFLAISYFMANFLDRFSPHSFRRFDNLVVLP